MKKTIILGILILGIAFPLFVLAPYNNKLYTGLAPFGEDFPIGNWKENFGQIQNEGGLQSLVISSVAKILEAKKVLLLEEEIL